MQHSSDLPPVVRTFVGCCGNVVGIPYSGTWADLCRNYVKSLPQNVAMFQGGNHAILANVAAEDMRRRPVAVGAGQPCVLRDMQGGSEAGQ